MGLSSIGARAGGIVAPLVVLLVSVHLRTRSGGTNCHASWCVKLHKVCENYWSFILFFLQAQYSDTLPMLLIGGLSLVGGFTSLSLPETLNKPLPETLAELETAIV